MNRSTQDAPAAKRSSVFNHPLGFWFIFWGEFAERCSYYGMRAILLLYMIDQLGFERSSASRTMSLFIAGCYLLPLVGGYVADNFLGKYWTIIAFSLPYVLGHVVIGFESPVYLFTALALLAMGSGVIKPNISTLMGLTYDQKRPGQERLRSDAFAMFYGAVNIGAAVSSFAMPVLRDRYGYQLAFLFPAALMVLALLFFALGKPFYAVETVRRTRLTPEERRERWVVLRRILGLFIVVTFFWSIFDQASTTWTLFARDGLQLKIFDYAEGTWQWSTLAWIRDTMHLDLIGITLAPDQLQGLNPILIVLLLPPITIMWHVLGNLGLRLRPTDKMTLGFILTFAGMTVMSVAGYRSAEVGRVSILWEVAPYILITTAEICISVVGLELAFSAAPSSMKSFVTACWLLTVFFGNLLNSLITPYYDETLPWGGKLAPGPYFALFAGLMVVVTIAFVVIARRFNRPSTE